MFGKTSEADLALKALDRAMAVIEFTPEGEILTANENFLKVVGYSLSEVKGRPHRIFVPPALAESPDYKAFWANLAAGRFQAGEFKRIGKGGRTVWLEANYFPVIDSSGRVVKVVKSAADVTARKLRSLEDKCQIEAIGRSQAVIHFELDGTILDANENFLKTVGYNLEEIKGRHHSMFVEPQERGTPAYAEFWASLRRGTFQQAEFRRLGKGGREIWIQATYTPIVDDTGTPFKVVKFATDITASVQRRALRAQAQAEIAADLTLISEDVAKTNMQAASASAATQQAASNVQSVAAGAEELAASADELRRQVQQSSELAKVAELEGSRTNSIVAGLTGAAQKIGDVVALIDTIANQTNLLALNATIEAARAGEAGKGFSVVASEVKTLAGQTSKATSEIAAQVDAVQQASEDAARALSAITRTIADLNSVSAAIAAAVEEQTAVTREVSGNMHVAAQGVETVRLNMQEIARATGRVEGATQKVRTASAALA
ncbi:PAS domain-containing methyl-accepting chemotaxis protein [Aquabacter sp. L1I39]|uniref:methyl-accepting chemotaxis protein n=1 Tax=Aquabacter sp. L1I39 TaxID=2820278 RepID=UPI001ADB7BB1|nr:PAS domain-containing methyl-accepting chemotaxis protein [Aquabacter sp. L1I39]QTL05015.1 PAS domain-containing methyl-accepting chemotaxis protein [Aquabacter sp. L1I39]